MKLRDGQKLHFELGRAVVGQMGSLITKTLYIKQGTAKQFAIVDAGMTDLIRPALYQAYHKIENISSDEPAETYDVVGPICESSDVFAKAVDLNKTHRGDLIALRSAGAYGEIMRASITAASCQRDISQKIFKGKHALKGQKHLARAMPWAKTVLAMRPEPTVTGRRER